MVMEIDLTGGRVLRGGTKYNNILIEKDGKLYVVDATCACNSGFWYINIYELTSEVEKYLPDATRKFLEDWRRNRI
jgi:hypothetical protein